MKLNPSKAKSETENCLCHKKASEWEENTWMLIFRISRYKPSQVSILGPGGKIYQEPSSLNKIFSVGFNGIVSKKHSLVWFHQSLYLERFKGLSSNSSLSCNFSHFFCSEHTKTMICFNVKLETFKKLTEQQQPQHQLQQQHQLQPQHQLQQQQQGRIKKSWKCQFLIPKNFNTAAPPVPWRWSSSQLDCLITSSFCSGFFTPCPIRALIFSIHVLCLTLPHLAWPGFFPNSYAETRNRTCISRFNCTSLRGLYSGRFTNWATMAAVAMVAQ